MTTETWAVVEHGILVEGHDAERIVPWWSFTKTVLAAAALTLVRDGSVRLDEPLPGRPYTLRHLLQHRSGLPDYGGLRAYHEAVAREDDPWPVSTLWEIADADRLHYEPGQGWAYSNIGYLLVRQVIESRTCQSLDEALRRLVLDPLRIGSARIANERRDLGDVAMGEAKNYHPGWVYHGLLVGSVRDAALLLDRLMTEDLLPSVLREEMLAPFVLAGPIPERPWKVPGYGLGVMRGEAPHGPVAGHTGGGPGSTVAVYHALSGKALTAAVFRTAEDQGRTEEKAFGVIAG
ncbi:serine hydrolase domain-containing protein [Microvirga sp. 2TAF3]|uniref:serine hydrolase domain-containing protein n=1 Tax=Microvirga sp. 2TAF3 TaxID=3233014 RepID=UPI003F9D191C